MRPAALTIAALAVATAVTAGPSFATTGTGALHAFEPAGHQYAKSTPRVTLKDQIEAALKGSSAGKVAWRFDVSGIADLSQRASATQRPASNNKLFIGQVALQQLGPDYRFRTLIERRGPIANGVLKGSLVVIASGDPTLGDGRLTSLAKQVKAAGIKRVNDGLIIDTAGFEHRTTAPGWHHDFTPDDVGPVDGFAVDYDGSSSTNSYLSHTAQQNGAHLVRALQKVGVKVKGPIKVNGDTGLPIGSTVSPPLSRIVDGMLTDSINFDAEMLLDDIGGFAPNGSDNRTDGLTELRSVATKFGVKIGQDYDGSGLSYSDAESPDTFVKWLEASATSSTGVLLRNALPVSCETGTLEHRLCGSASKGQVFAKTGTLDHTSALSGYTKTASGRAVTFSILLDNVGNIDDAIKHIDAAVSVVTRFSK